DCSASDSCELILPDSESDSGTGSIAVEGSGVQLNVSNSAIIDSFIAFRSRSNLLISQPLVLGSHSSLPYEFIAGSNCVASHQSVGNLNGNFVTSSNGTIWANDQDIVIEAWSVSIGSVFNLSPSTHTNHTGNLYIDACPGATGLTTPGMDVAIGSPKPSESGAPLSLSERFQLSAESISYLI